MRSYTIKIAGYNISFSASGEDIILEPSKSQSSFITSESNYDLILNVSAGPTTPDNSATPVFRAPFVEEINGVMVKQSDRFWTVYSHGDYILISTTLPLCDRHEEALLIIRPGEKSWDLIFDSASEKIDPFAYPLDGLITYYLTALNGDIFIHGSGVEFQGRGYLFSGVSGKGKTTIAKLFSDQGGKVIHDDRLVVRNIEGKFFLFNTPVYHDEESKSALLDAIYLIDHGIENASINQGVSESLTGVMANCIQHNWNTSIIGNLTGALLKLVTSVPVKKLLFVPDRSVIQFIKGDE